MKPKGICIFTFSRKCYWGILYQSFSPLMRTKWKTKNSKTFVFFKCMHSYSYTVRFRFLSNLLLFSFSTGSDRTNLLLCLTAHTHTHAHCTVHTHTHFRAILMDNFITQHEGNDIIVRVAFFLHASPCARHTHTHRTAPYNAIRNVRSFIY